MIRKFSLSVLALTLIALGCHAIALAGAVPGPQTRNNYVSAKYDKTDTYFFVFKGGEPARIRVINQSNKGDINLYVYDLDGRLLVSDVRRDDDADVTFYPRNTDQFRVVVRAVAGNSPLKYQLRTN